MLDTSTGKDISDLAVQEVFEFSLNDLDVLRGSERLSVVEASKRTRQSIQVLRSRVAETQLAAVQAERALAESRLAAVQAEKALAKAEKELAEAQKELAEVQTEKAAAAFRARKMLADAQIEAVQAEKALADAKEASRVERTSAAVSVILNPEPEVSPVSLAGDSERWQKYMRGLLGSEYSDCTFHFVAEEHWDQLGVDEQRYRAITKVKDDGRFANIVVAVRRNVAAGFFFVKLTPKLSFGRDEFLKNRLIQTTVARKAFVAPLGHFVSDLGSTPSEAGGEWSFLVFPWVRSTDLSAIDQAATILRGMTDKHWVIGLYNLVAALHHLESPPVLLNNADLHHGQVLVTADFRLLFIDLGLAEVEVVDSDGHSFTIHALKISGGSSDPGASFHRKLRSTVCKHLKDDELRKDVSRAMSETTFHRRAQALKRLISAKFTDVALPDDPFEKT